MGKADKEATLRADTLTCAVLSRLRPNFEGEELILLALLMQVGPAKNNTLGSTDVHKNFARVE
jgi:hypothetical protein